MTTPAPLTLGDLATSLKGMSRADFLARHPHPFLFRQNEPGGAVEGLATTTAFNTMGLDPKKIRARAQKILTTPIFPVVKREGGNAFGLMVTMGRAANNDIVFPDQQVSKFHASLSKNHQGQWTLTDASSNGTWVDGVKLETRTPCPLRLDSSIDLARAVSLSFLVPERVFAEVESIWRREAHA